MPFRNPIKDQIALSGIGRTKYGRDLPGRSRLSLGLEASRKAILDCGLDKREIDGICGTLGTEFEDLQDGLGIPELTWGLNVRHGTQAQHQLQYAAEALFSGQASAVLVTRSQARERGAPSPSGRSHEGRDPIADRSMLYAYARQHPGYGFDHAALMAHANPPYYSWTGRYMHDYGAPRELFGLISMNMRSNAARNEEALLRFPITMDDYLQSRWIREPVCLLDCDYPCGGGMAMVLTTADRARELPNPPVLIHAMTTGQSEKGVHYYEQYIDYRHLAPWTVADALWAKSDLRRDDIDLFISYDGVTVMALTWLEAMGWCGCGEAYEYLRRHWNDSDNRVELDGRVLWNTHGGQMNAGADNAFGLFFEAALQLRGQASGRQVADCDAVLLLGRPVPQLGRLGAAGGMTVATRDAEISDADVFARFPQIELTRDNVWHFRGLLQKRFLLNRCEECFYWIYPHSPVCPHCWSERLAPTEVSGKGTVFYFLIYHQAQPLGTDPNRPYPLVAVELAERTGLRYITTVVNCPYEEIYMGMPVELVWIERLGVPAPVFQPAPGAPKGQAPWR